VKRRENHKGEKPGNERTCANRGACGVCVKASKGGRENGDGEGKKASRTKDKKFFEKGGEKIAPSETWMETKRRPIRTQGGGEAGIPRSAAELFQKKEKKKRGKRLQARENVEAV